MVSNNNKIKKFRFIIFLYNIYMPEKREHREKKHRHRSPSTSSSHESSSSSTTEQVIVNIKKRHSKRTSSESKSSKSKYSSSSSCSPKKCQNKKKECESSVVEYYSNDKKDRRRSSKKSSTSSCSSSSDNCSFEEIYKYYKYRLLKDHELMPAGSTAYLNSYDNDASNTPRSTPVEITNIDTSKNIDHLYPGSPFYVREAGIYILFYMASTDNPSQYCIFVNGVEQPLTRTGQNSGSGQLILRTMLKLKENDAVLVRNSDSSAVVVYTQQNIGGSQIGNNDTVLLTKIAPYCLPKIDKEWNEECLSKRNKYLFRKLVEKMLLDKDLMLKGFNIRGSFFTKTAQTVLPEQDLVFDNFINVNGLQWNPTGSNPEQVKVLEDGVYKIFANAHVGVSAQFAITVNGVAVIPGIQGINKGATPLTSRTLLQLKKGDVLTVRNHTTSPFFNITTHAGGLQETISLIFTIFKIAPLASVVEECKLNNHHKKCYEKFKSYLLSRCDLQVAGPRSYFSVTGDVHQTIVLNDAFDWPNNALIEGMHHHQGTKMFKVEHDGIYDLFVDTLAYESQQLTLFINGLPDLSTTFGRDSGGGRLLMRQLVKLNKGDVLTVNNYESNTLALNTSINAGGLLVGHNALFMGFILCPIDVLPPKKCSKKQSKKQSRKGK